MSELINNVTDIIFGKYAVILIFVLVIVFLMFDLYSSIFRRHSPNESMVRHLFEGRVGAIIFISAIAFIVALFLFGDADRILNIIME